MTVAKLGRKIRPRHRRAAKLAVTGVAVMAGAAMTIGPAPTANAAVISVQQQVLTAGPLLDLLALAGIDTIPDIPLGTIDLGFAQVQILLTATLTPVPYDTQSIYNTINAMPFQPRLSLGFQTQPNDRVVQLLGGSAGQYPAYLSSGIGTLNTVKAWRDQLASVAGDTANGYTPFEAGNPSNDTNEAFLMLRNPLRPNGGIMTRFAPLFNLFGVDTTLPAAGISSNDAGTITLNTSTVDVSWAYDPLADFPVTLNPFSLINSLLASVPTNLLGGVSLQGLTDGSVPVGLQTGLILNLASVLGFINRESDGLISFIAEGKSFYGTLVPNQLPILDPLRLPVRLINLVSNALGMPLNLGTPIADALEPAAKILVNIGYSDVIPPDKLDSCAAFCKTDAPQTYTQLGYGAYDRSYLTSSTQQPFLSVNPLTPQEWLQVPGDVVAALIEGFTGAVPPRAPASPAAAAARTATTSASSALSTSRPQARAGAPRKPAIVKPTAARPTVRSAAAARR